MSLAKSALARNRFNGANIGRKQLSTLVSHLHRDRFSSSALQRPIVFPVNTCRWPQSSRNMAWWSFSRPATVSSPETASIPHRSSDEPNSSITQNASTENVEVSTSTSAAHSADSIPPDVSGCSAEADTWVPEDLAETVMSNIPPPLQYGDLAELGLITWTPAGAYRWILEVINVSTGLPWFYTIVVGSIAVRVLLFPVVARNIRDTARLRPFRNQIASLVQARKEAAKSRDTVKLQLTGVKQQKIYKDAGVKLGVMMFNGFAQIPVAMGIFFGLKKMCELPVEQLKHSGLDILPDMTVAISTDPWLYSVAIICTALLNVQMRIGSREMDVTASPGMAHFSNYMLPISFAFIPFMTWLPVGIYVSLGSTSVAMIATSLILRQPAVRRALGIPIIEQAKPPTFKETWMYTMTWKDNFLRERDAYATQQAALETRRRRRY